MKKGVWKKHGKGPEWLGGYEMIQDTYQNYCRGFYVRKFTLVRIPKRGPIKKRTLYFKSAQEAKSKGWEIV
jgi:hypothetical protein